MDAADVLEVCRLCPMPVGDQDLLNVFDKTISFKYNIREVILIYTGIEILENDLVSKKICQRCCKILYKMYEFRHDALKQDRQLKDKCGQYLENKGMRLPNTCITIKRETIDSSLRTNKIKKEPSKVPPLTRANEEVKNILHPSIEDVFRNYPNFKLPRKCFERHMAPVVSLTMGEVEKYFQKRQLNINKFIYNPRIKTRTPQNIAKKKTLPAREKTVAPLKISRKLIVNGKKQDKCTDKGYICLSVPKEVKGLKRKVSSDSDPSLEKKLSRKSQPESLPVDKLNADLPKAPINNDIPGISGLVNPSNRIPKLVKITSPIPFDSLSVNKTPSPTPTDPFSKNRNSAFSTPIDLLSGNSTTPSPTPIDPNSAPPSPASANLTSEDSRDSCSTNLSVATVLDTKKPQFMESFGLTPTVTATKSHTLLVCSSCGSVHHNAYELKKHARKHMVCQFCKLQFKSVESKKKHIEDSCQIKKVMNSAGPWVKLEKIHLNLDFRLKYKSAFVDFQLIPGLQEIIPVEEVILKEASPPPPTTEDAVIVLSDEEDVSAARSPDPLSDIPTRPTFENVVYSTVSIVKPDIRIKNNTLLMNMTENLSDKQLMKNLIGLLKPSLKPTTAETMLQTDFPASKDIKIHNENTCEFKNLKGQLSTYKIPITISNGSFYVAYQFRNNNITNKCFAFWDDLPIVDVPAQLPVQGNSRTSDKSSLAKTSFQMPLLDVAVPLGPILNSTFIQTAPVVTTINSGLVTVQGSPVLNTINVIPINTSNSATPLLQNYALSMTPAPVISNPLPIPRTYINSALNKPASTSNRSLSLSVDNNPATKPLTSFKISYYNTIPPTSSPIVSKPGSVSINSPGPPSTSSSVISNEPPINYLTNASLPTIATVTQSTNHPLTSSSGRSSDSSLQESSRFRVKSVWELQ